MARNILTFLVSKKLISLLRFFRKHMEEMEVSINIYVIIQYKSKIHRIMIVQSEDDDILH